MSEHSAIALFSGGLDSILTVKWMQTKGYTVYPIFFRTPYIPSERAEESARRNGYDLRVVDVSDAHLQMMRNPRYGFGKHFNPCIDCHALMFNHAGALLPQLGASYIISGEVLGQRPMSQRRSALHAVANLSGYKDLLIRPLSQKLLPDTMPIREGWVDKEDLLALHGRGRNAQIALAKELGITYYPTPGGGCLLTDRNFSLRLKDLADHDQANDYEISLLRWGRHFRLSPHHKMIIGRTEADCTALDSAAQHGIKMLLRDVPGPLGVLVGPDPDQDLIRFSASLLLSYSRKSPSEAVVLYHVDNISPSEIVANKLSDETLNKYKISLD